MTLPGDGIGPEVMAAGLELLHAVGDDVEVEEHVFGGASIDAHGTALTDEVLDACRRADAVLLAAVGGPKWDTTDPARPRSPPARSRHPAAPRSASQAGHRIST